MAESGASTGRTESAHATEADLSRFIVKLGDKLAVTPCLEFVLYLDVTDDRAILDFYLRCREALGERLTHFQAENMNSFRKLNARGNSLVPTWFTQPRAGKIDYYIYFGGCDLNAETSPATLLMRVMRNTAADAPQRLAKLRAARRRGPYAGFYPTSDLRLTLPLDHPLAEPEKLRDWVLEFDLLKSATGFSGFVGYALNYMDAGVGSDLYEKAEQSLAPLCRRYPGFGVEDGSSQSAIFRYRAETGDILPRIKRANWLTLLCDRTVEAAGGAESLEAALAGTPHIQTGRLLHGLWIQAGAAPQHGDLAEGDLIPSYRHVAKALRSVRIEKISALSKWFYTEETSKWLNAFDVEDDCQPSCIEQSPPLESGISVPSPMSPEILQAPPEPRVEVQVWDLPQQDLIIDVRGGAHIVHFRAQGATIDDDNIPDPIDAFVAAARLGMFTHSAVPPWDSTAMVVACDTATEESAVQYRVKISNLDRGALRVLTNLLRARDLDAVTIRSAAPTSATVTKINLTESYPQHFKPVDFLVDYEMTDHSQRDRMVRLTFVNPPSAAEVEAACAGLNAWTMLLTFGGYPRDDDPPAHSSADPDAPFLFDDYTIEQGFPEMFLCDEACFNALINWVQSFNRSVAAIDKLTIH